MSTNLTTKALQDHNMSTDIDSKMDIIQLRFMDRMQEIALYYIAVGGIAMVAGYLQTGCWLLTSSRQAHQARHALLRAILNQNVGWFDTQDVRQFNNRLVDDVNKFEEGVGDKLGHFFQDTTTFVTGFVIGFIYSWKLCLVIFGFTPFLVASGIFLNHMLTGMTGKELDSYARAAAVAEEVIASVRTVVAYGGERKEVNRYAANLTEAKVFGIRKSRASGLGIGCVYVIMFSAYGLVFWFGAKMVQDGDLTVGRLITVFFCILVAAFMLGKAAPCLETFATGRAAARALWQIIDRIPPIDSGSYSGVRPSRMEGNVVFKDVNFSYPSRATVQVLNGLSLNVAVGQTVALVGASGCGKSTVIQLIQRFYDPLGGAIYIDNQPINELNVRYLRRRIGVVSQEPVLFATTIAENIRYGLEEANQEDIESAARQANAHNFIMELPKKYDTLVGERGAQLSGGQKQRIAIARALVRDPRILLLDEATSALDTESEATVQAALDKARMGRTTIVVAHRLSTIKTADLIIGMKDGMAVEQGSHDELMDQKGIYCELVTRQISQLVELESANTSGTRPTGRTLTSDRTTESLHAKRVDSQNDSRVACVEDTEELAKPSMKRILRLNSREWPCIFLGCCMALLVGAQQPAFAIIFSEFLGVFVETDRNKQQKEIRFYCVMFVVIGFVSGVAKFLQMYMFGISGECLTLRLRRLTFQTLLRQEIGFFDDPRHGTGALMTRLSTDASDVHGASGSRLAVALEGGSSVIAGVFIGLYYSWELTLLIFGFTPLLVIAIKITMKMTGGHAAQGSDALEEAGKLAVEAMENIRTVASLSKEASFVRQYKHLTEKPYRRRLQTVNMIGLSFGFSQALIYLMQSVAFYGGAWLIEHRGLTFENMFKVFGGIMFGAKSAGQATSFAPDYGKAKTAAARVLALLDRRSQIDTYADVGAKPATVSGAIQFEDVEFRYPSRPTVAVLRGMSFTVEPGTTVALVGTSGCGKSTTTQLLERFYDPTRGAALVDGRRLGEYNIAWLRAQIGLVSQEPGLFNCSIAENIAYGDNSREVPMNEITEAARQANIHNFIVSLPQGYETNVGDKGVQMSGGQKQRIAIARALVRNPKILLLDEATSALDTESEKVVQDALDKAQKGRTSIVIAHRLSTIQNADSICVMRDGRVIEVGTHSQLVTKQGTYYDLNMRQMD